jgi:hypothetical protein
MDENIKNLREAQQQSGTQKNDSSPQEDTESVDVQVLSAEKQEEESQRLAIAQREDVIKNGLEDAIVDPMMNEGLADVVVEQETPKKTPLRKLMKISRKLGLKMARDAFEEDDPAAFTALVREVRGLATQDYSEAEVDVLHSFRKELNLLRKRAKKSISETELTPFEITKVDTVVGKIINVQEILLESDLPFIIEDTNDVDDGEGDISNLENLDASMIDPTDQEQLLDDEIYLVEIEEEEADDYTRWSEPILQLIAVRDPKELD